MNTVSLNNLWTYLQGLTLTASDKKWLADHLYESVRNEEMTSAQEGWQTEAKRMRKEKEREFWTSMPRWKKEDLVPSQDIFDIVKDVVAMPEDIDSEKVKSDYLMQKYG